MSKREMLGKKSFVETQTGVRGSFKVEASEIGFDRDMEEDFATLRVSMADSYGMFEAHTTELNILFKKIDKASKEFGAKPLSEKWRFVPRSDPMGPLPHYTKKFIFPIK